MLSAELKHNKLINKVDPNLEIESDRQGLEFILRNLLGNSQKFTSVGEISVDAEITEKRLKLTIKDTGIGMSIEAQNSIFNRQWKSYNLGTDDEKGSGTGLKLVFEYLQSVHGSFNITSKKGEGTLIEVIYPI